MISSLFRSRATRARHLVSSAIRALTVSVLLAVALSAMAQDYEPVDYLGHNTAVSVAEGQIGITAPGAVNLGDFLIAQIAFTGGSSVNFTSTPDNWQLLVREDQADNLGHAVFYKIVGNPGTIPSPGTAFQWVFDTDISAVGAITRYSGVDFNDPIQVTASQRGESTAMKVPGVSVAEPGNVINLYAMGAIADIRKPGSRDLRYDVNNPDPVTAALRDYRVDVAPTETNNDVVLGFADGSRAWVTHTVAVRARSESLADAFNSLISANPLQITADGSSTSTITVQARDSAGNNLGTGGDEVILETDAGTLLGSVVDNGDGSYTQQLQSATTAGTASVTGTINGFDIAGSATVEFVAGDVSALGSAIAAADSQLPADGSSGTEITVQARDAQGNAVAESGLPVTLSTDAGTLAATSGSTDAGGRFITTLTAAGSAATATVSGTLDGTAIGNTASVEFVEIIPPVDATQSTISAAGDTLIADGADSTTVTVQIRDAGGNPIQRAGVSVELSAQLGSLAATSGQTDANGQFSTVLTAPTSVGTDTISGRVLGENIGNTAQVDYIAGAADKLQFAQQPTGAAAGEAFAAGIEIVDANGNRVSDAGTSITLQLTQPNGATLSGTTTVTATNGTASVGDLSIDLAGDYTLTASASGLDAAVSRSFSITAASVSGPDSEITANPDEIEGDGVSTSDITVQALDGFGNPVAEAGLAVTLSTTLGSLTETSGTTNADGRFVTTLTSEQTIGTAEITGTLDGQPIGNTASVVFTLSSGGDPVEATALAFDIEPRQSIQNHPIRGPVTVGFVDGEGTPVDTYDGDITIQIESGPTGATLGGTTTRTSQDGFVVFDDITLDTLGQYTLRATSDGMNDAVSVPFEVREDGLFSDRFEAPAQ